MPRACPGDRLAPGSGLTMVGLRMIPLGPERNSNWPSHHSYPRGCLVPDIVAGTLLEAEAWLQGGILEHFHS